MPNDPERRRHPRIKAKISLELLCPNAAPMRTATDEISACGCYIETMFTIDVGTKIDLLLSVNNERIRIQAVVATKYPQVGNGIDFLSIAPEDRLKLTKFISESER